jgi:hypothetical protein
MRWKAIVTSNVINQTVIRANELFNRLTAEEFRVGRVLSGHLVISLYLCQYCTVVKISNAACTLMPIRLLSHNSRKLSLLFGIDTLLLTQDLTSSPLTRHYSLRYF